MRHIQAAALKCPAPASDSDESRRAARWFRAMDTLYRSGEGASSSLGDTEFILKCEEWRRIVRRFF